MKYGTIAVDTMISLIIPFMPHYLSKQEIHSIAIILITMVAPTISVSSMLKNPNFLSSMGIFCYKATSNTLYFGGKALYYTGKASLHIVKNTLEIATDILLVKPIYLICYPFKSNTKVHTAYEKIDIHESCKKMA